MSMSSDEQHPRPDRIFDQKDSYSGQAFRKADNDALVAADPSGGIPSPVDEPGEAGKRASFDPKTGEVHGSGSGIAGGNPDEEFDNDRQSGAD